MSSGTTNPECGSGCIVPPPVHALHVPRHGPWGTSLQLQCGTQSATAVANNRPLRWRRRTVNLHGRRAEARRRTNVCQKETPSDHSADGHLKSRTRDFTVAKSSVPTHSVGLRIQGTIGKSNQKKSPVGQFRKVEKNIGKSSLVPQRNPMTHRPVGDDVWNARGDCMQPH